jgi:hypothetical protein
LVDGLDEVLEATRRTEVLRAVAALTRAGRGAEYRVVLTTRPLRGGELAGALARTGWAAERYLLLPFDKDNVRELARRWFTALGVADPGRATGLFAATLERRGLLELARTPLMAAMLCQLYADQLSAAAPDQDLPGSRGEIYRLYYQRLINRLYAPGPSGAFRQEALARFGPDAAAGAVAAVQGLPTALGQLAVQRRAGNRDSTLRVVLADPGMRRPGDLEPEEWREFAASVLRRSGLLDFRGGDFTFLHQTLLDFLAARAALDRAGALAAMLAVVPPPQSRSPAAGSRRRRTTERARSNRWRPPVEDASYLGFLLDPGAHDDPLASRFDLDGALLELAEHGGLAGCQFLTAQIALHTALPDAVRQRTQQELAELGKQAGTGSDQRRALRTLAVIDREQALAIAVAKAPHQVGYRTDFEIFLLIASLNRQQAVALLAALVTTASSRRYPEGVIRGAEILTALDPPVGMPVLRTLATRVSKQEREAAQRAAYRSGGGEKLREVLRAQRETPRDEARVAAAEALARADRQEGIAALARLAGDGEADSVARVRAAAAVVRYGDGHGAGLLRGAVRDTLVQALDANASYAEVRKDLSRRLAGSRKDHRSRLRAEAATAIRIHRDTDAAAAAGLLAEQSATQKSRSGRAWLATLATDTTAAERTEPARTLTSDQLFSRFTELRASLSRPPGIDAALILPDPARSLPSELSSDLSDPAAADFLARYATDHAEIPDRWGDRHQPLAIAQLLRLRDPRAENLLSAFLADDSTRSTDALTAISGLR